MILFKIATMHLIIFVYVCMLVIFMFMYVCLCLCLREMNDSNDTRDEYEESGLFCYCQVLYQPQSSIVLFESGLGLIVKCVLQTLGQTIEKTFFCITDMLRKERKTELHKMINKNHKRQKKRRQKSNKKQGIK